MTFKHETNKAIKIFSELYVGVRAALADGSVPLAFATPYEENAAGLKRQQTVLNWLGGEYEYPIENGRYVYENGQRKAVKVQRDLRVLKNTLRSGFKITDDVKRVYWGGGNVVFRVQDPYGFELEIESGNLMALIQTVGITAGGEVPVPCIWGRDGSKNILITEGSVEYQSSVKAAESIVKPKALGQAEKFIGSTYRLADGTFGQYLGKLYLITSTETTERSNSRGPAFRVSTMFNGLHVVGAVESTRVDRTLRQYFEQYEAVLEGTEVEGEPLGSRTVKLYKKASFVQRLDTLQITAEEAASIANQCRISTATRNYYNTCEALSIQEPNSASYIFRNLSDAEFAAERKRLEKALQGMMSFNQSAQLTINPLLQHSNTLLRVQQGADTMMYSRSVQQYIRNISPMTSFGEGADAQPAAQSTQITLAAPCSIMKSTAASNIDDTVQFLRTWEHNHRPPYTNAASPSALVLPSFSTAEETLQYLDVEYKAGNLFTIGVQVK